MKTYPSAFNECLTNARALLGDGDDAVCLWDANDLVNRAIALDPCSGEAWLLKCQILSALGDDVAALAAITMALDNPPTPAEFHYWHAAVLADLERYDDGLAAIDRAFRRIGADDGWLIEDLYFERAAVLAAVGRHDAALATYEAGLQRCPDSAILQSGLEPLRRERARQKFTVIRGGLS
jgi:tetratricopeptide (TPR) repeat protein